MADPSVAASGDGRIAATTRSRESAHRCMGRSDVDARQTEILDEFRDENKTLSLSIQRQAALQQLRVLGPAVACDLRVIPNAASCH